MIKKLVYILLLNSSAVCYGQSLTGHIMGINNQKPITFNDLSFSYQSTDTVTGLEIALVYKKKNRCSVNILFVENINWTDLNKKNLFRFLQAAKTDYHRINYGAFHSLYGCNYTTPDTFYYCSNGSAYLENNFKGYFDTANFFSFSKNEIFAAYRTTVVLDRFRSGDVQHAQYYYHFMRDRSKLTSMEKVQFRQVLKRERLTNNKVLKAKKWKGKLNNCVATAH